MNSSFKKDIFRIDFAPLLENALVAQPDRVSASEAEGCGFDPRRARQKTNRPQGWFCLRASAGREPTLGSEREVGERDFKKREPYDAKGACLAQAK